MGARCNRLAEAVLTSTRGLCFWHEYEKYQTFYLKVFLFWLKFLVYLNSCVFVTKLWSTGIKCILIRDIICI